MADTIRNVIIKLTMQVEQAKVKAPDMSAVEKSLKDHEKRISDTIGKSLSGLEKQATATSAKIAESSNAVTQSVTRAQKSQQTFADASAVSGLKAAEGFKVAGEGAFMLARGVAFLSSDSEESFKAMIENVARVQGAFDLFKGGTDVVKGLTEGFRALGGGAGALAGVDKGISAIVGVASKLFSPVGLLTAGAGIAFVALTQLAKGFDDSAASAEVLRRNTESANAALSVARQFIDSDSRQRASRSEVSRLHELGGGTTQESLLRAQIQQEFGRREFQSRFKFAASLNDSSLNDLTGGKTGIRAITDAAQSQISNPNVAIERRLAIAEELQSYQENEAALQREAVRLSEQMLRATEQERESKRSLLEITKQQLDAEKARVSSFEASIGRLSAADFASVQRITDRVKQGGELRREEAEFLQGTGVDFLGQAAGNRFAEFGRERGAGQIAQAFGAGSQVGEREQQIQNLERELKDLNGIEGKLRESLAGSARELRETIERFVISNITSTVAQLRQELEAKSQEARQ